MEYRHGVTNIMELLSWSIGMELLRSVKDTQTDVAIGAATILCEMKLNIL